MAGEITGTSVIVQKGAADIVGQMEMSVAFSGTPIDISSKSTGDNIALIDGEVVAQQMTISGTIVYNDNAVYRAIRAEYLSGAHATYSFVYTSDATTDESFSASCQVTGLSDTIPHGDKVSTSVTFVSSGTITHQAAS